MVLKCKHIDCRKSEKVWLPYIVKAHNKGLKPHSYCIRCGMVKNIGADRVVSRGHFINVISRLEEHLNIPGSSIRKRLVIKDLEKIEDFDDAYSMSRHSQERIFTSIIKKYYQISDGTIQQFL